ncbi:hypothetical protein, partial [Yersinia sp. 2542 StPb PI]|uniref:hypothetical protein n=1 Tax=Yersinia sp. 2542 StPb PI TaxID=3117408 RepID=UPI003B286618
MAWQGIPFIPEHIISNSYLAISKVPKIIIDSGFAWEAVIATVAGSFIAGAIPALIAWKSITNSNKLLTSQLKLTQSIEMNNKIRDFSAQYAAEVEIIGSLMLAKRKVLIAAGKSIEMQDVSELFEAARKLNSYTNSVLLLLNTDNLEYKSIEKSFKNCESIIREATKKEIPLDAVNLPGIENAINEFLNIMRRYLKIEMKS